MTTVRIQTGDIEPVEVLAIDSSRVRLTGLTNLKVKVRRQSDSNLFDWSTNEFVASPVLFLQDLEEVDPVNFPGEYRLNATPHIRGFNTSSVVNPVVDDIYFVTVEQVGSPQTAIGAPWRGEIKVGSFVDNIDEPISDQATPSEVSAEVKACMQFYGLDHLVSVNPGIVPPAANTYIRQILDNQAAAATVYTVLQTYSYNATSDTLEGIIWLESGNLVFNDPSLAGCTVSWYDAAGSLQFSMSDATPDSQGFYRVSQATPGLGSDSIYYAVAEVVITGTGTVSGGKGNFTF